MTDEQRRKQGFKKGHKNLYACKKMDYKQFIKAYNLYTVDRKINQEDFARLVGVSAPTIKKRLTDLVCDGIIDGKYFTNGQSIKSDWYDLKQEQYEKVRQAYRRRAEIENKEVVTLIIRQLESAWYMAKKQQKEEVAEGLDLAVNIARGALYDSDVGAVDPDSADNEGENDGETDKGNDN